jgi:ubiquinone/menaquinone biosynthesis C-methylase UbiE
MDTHQGDRWAAWMLHRRFGGDPAAQAEMLRMLTGVRDRVLDNARLAPGETLLDVGTGDGLIAFGALDRLGPDGTVIFSDISADLLAHCRALAADLGVTERCRFVPMAADDLSPLADESVDAVTTRSVLIFVQAKATALREFYRVLRPGGRMSLFEPINRFGYPEPPGRFAGYDMTPVADLVAAVRGVFHRRQPPETSTMLDFDERDLLRLAEQAGFAEVHLTLDVTIAPGGMPGAPQSWATFLHSAANPLVPSLAEALAEALSPADAARFTAHLRPLVEAGAGIRRSAFAFLSAVK